MSFFLVRRSPNGDLSLLSSVGLDTKQDALAELSRVTSDPAFDDWDSEVFVVDLDAATPVLLVRPAAQPRTGTAEEPAADVGVEAAFDQEAGAAQSAEPDEAVEPAPAAEEPQAEQVAEAETVVTDEAAEATLAAESDDLKEALLRTTEQMAASGVVPPESIGPEAAESSAVETATPLEPASWPWDEAAVQPAEPAPAPADSETVAEPETEPEPETAPYVPDVLEEPAREVSPLITAAGDDDTIAAARPVILGADAEPASAVGPVPAEEPADEVSVGATAEPAAEDAPTGSDEGEAEPTITPEAPEAEAPVEAETQWGPAEHPAPDESQEPVSAEVEGAPEVASEDTKPAGAADEATGEEPAPAQGTGDDISDFILDLGAPPDILPSDLAAGAPSPAEDPSESAPPSAPFGSDLAELSCGDCVYVDTCPNKEERDPSSCGSFQWK